MRVHPTLIVAGFWFITVALLAVGLGAKLKFVWPVGALGCGWLLLQKAPRHYLSFVWMLWFFQPFVRRMVDFASHGFDSKNPCMLAGPVVTGLCIVQLLRRSHLWRRPEVLPFLMIFGGAIYALGRGIGEHGLFSPTYDSLEWVVPPALAAYVFVYRDVLLPLDKTFLTTFSIGVLIMGVYGLVQFLSPLPWDAFWMNAVPMASNGQPVPYQVRVFSTMNSPGPFSLIMMSGLLLLVSGGGLLRWLALGPGLISFLLSLVRAAWGGWALGMIFIAARVTGRLKARLIAISIMLGVVVLPLLYIGPVADQISKRMQSLQSVDHDNSANVRMDMYVTSAATCFLNVPGMGLGSTGTASKLQNADGKLGELANFDSGLMNVPFVLGWPGTLLYVGGMLSLLMRVLRNPAVGKDLFLSACLGIAVGAFGQMIFINTLIGVQGMVFWCFLGVCLAGSAPTVTGSGRTRAPMRQRASSSGRPLSPIIRES